MLEASLKRETQHKYDKGRRDSVQGDKESPQVTETTLSLEGSGAWHITHIMPKYSVFDTPQETNGTLSSLSRPATAVSMTNERNMHLIYMAPFTEDLNIL